MKYFFVAFGWAYALSTPIFLTILNIKTIDVTLTAFMSLYIVPLAYGVYQYDLKNIKIFTKNTFVYGFLILICGTALVVINILHGYLLSTFSDLPIWFIPLISSLIIVSLSLVIWNQMHQVEILKYEFLNNISHKFRTPLTRIRWLTEDLRDSDDKDEKKKIADQIQFANMKLFELTDTVINTSKDNDLFLYHFTVITVGELLRDIHKAQMDEISQKKIDFEIQIPNPNLHIWADKNRLQFALQIIIENAVRYTPEGGWISFSVTEEEREVILICKDNGIGIAEGDIPHVFSKFYRSTEARKLDTEGMGLGLYMASNILEKHKGRITVESEGEHRGSIFKIILPIQ